MVFGMTEEMRGRFTAWWDGKKTDRPLIRLLALKKEQRPLPFDSKKYFKNAEDYHLSPEFRTMEIRNSLVAYDYLFDSFPYADLNLGPGSMAAYLGSEVGVDLHTIWYHPIKGCNSIGDLLNIGYEKSAPWWKKHYEILKKSKELAGGDFFICIPDIQENLDIVSAMRGPQELCFDIFDEPEKVKEVQAIVDRDFYKYFEDCYQLLKAPDNSSAFTAFSIWGKGRTAKIQCDFSALIGPETFDEFVIPALERQCDYLDNSLYHLDGKDAIRHLPALMKIDKLKALQWTPGAGQPDGASEQWYGIYDKVRDAGKSLWIGIGDGTPADWAEGAKKLLKRYGSDGVYLIFPPTDYEGGKTVTKILGL